MKTLRFVTTNEEKVRWANRHLNRFGYEAEQEPLELLEVQTVDMEEVVRRKASLAADTVEPPFFVEDTGLEIEALDRFPGALLKPVMQTIGAEGICRLMQGEENRRSHFKSVLAYRGESVDIKVVVADDTGEITSEPRGNRRENWGKMMKIHSPDGFDTTLAGMTEDEFERYEEERQDEEHYAQLGRWLEQ